MRVGVGTAATATVSLPSLPSSVLLLRTPADERFVVMRDLQRARALNPRLAIYLQVQRIPELHLDSDRLAQTEGMEDAACHRRM